MSGGQSPENELSGIPVMLERVLEQLDALGLGVAAAHVQMALDTLPETLPGLDEPDDGSSDGSSNAN